MLLAAPPGTQPGGGVCRFFAQHGKCKYGAQCKFSHAGQVTGRGRQDAAFVCEDCGKSCAQEDALLMHRVAKHKARPVALAATASVPGSVATPGGRVQLRVATGTPVQGLVTEEIRVVEEILCSLEIAHGAANELRVLEEDTLSPGDVALIAEPGTLLTLADRIQALDELDDWDLCDPPPPGHAWRTVWACANRDYDVCLDGGCSASALPEEVALRICNDALDMDPAGLEYPILQKRKYRSAVAINGLNKNRLVQVV